MNKIAVSAASGQLGSRIVRATISLVGKQQVVGLARTPRRAESLGVEIRPGDYEATEQLEQSLTGIDTLLLVSGMAKPDDRVQQHRNVINAAKVAGVGKIVYTSVQGAEENTAFSPVIQSNRQTEHDVMGSGLAWSIGRNGIYIEPDIEYLETYKRNGEIANCAGTGKCGYTTRNELAHAYACMLTETIHNSQVYNLHGEAITQQQLVNYFNKALGTDLKYRSISVDEYRNDRISELGEFIGGVIAGIYEGISRGAMDNESHFHAAAGRKHVSWDDYFGGLGTGEW